MARWLTAITLMGAVIPAATRVAASETDTIVPEEFASAKPLRLPASAERAAAAMALYLQALFEEESDGPDRSLETKRRVLDLDPGFADLAVECAHQYLRRGETTEAIAVLKDAAKANPKDTAPALALSTIYLRQLQKPDFAEKYALQSLAASPDDAGAYEALWDVYRSTSQRSKIEGLFQRATKRDIASSDFWLRMADLRLRDATADGSISPAETGSITVFLDRAVYGDADAKTLARAADYFVVFGQIDRAAVLYNRAIKLKPGLEGVRDRLAACLLQSGKPLEAAALLEENVKANPLDLQSYDLLGKIYWDSGEFPKALSKFRQSLLIAPPDPRRYDDAIRLSFLSRDPDGALAFAREAEKIFPKNPEFTVYRALALSEQKNHDEAMKAFEESVVQAGVSRPDLLSADFFFSYGVAAEQAGRFVKAAELLRKSIDLDPEKSARAGNYLGYMWADRGENLEEAEKLIRSALASEPDNGAYADSLGWVLFKQGRYQDALNELLRASSLLTEPDPVVLEHIGDACEKLGRTAEAVLYWQKAHQLDPSSKTLTTKLDSRSARVAQKPATSPAP